MAVHVRPASNGAGDAGAQVRDGERHTLLLRLVGHAGGLLRVEDGVELVDQAEHHGGISRATWRQTSQKEEKNIKMKNVVGLHQCYAMSTNLAAIVQTVVDAKFV